MLAAACSEPSTTAEFARVFDPCAPLVLSAPAAGDMQHASIAEAVAQWRAVGVTGPDPGGASDSLMVAFVSAAPGTYGLYDDVDAKILISDRLTEPARSIVIAHELGHAFGLVHVASDVRISVMNVGNLAIAPTEDDRAAITAIWGDCAVR